MSSRSVLAFMLTASPLAAQGTAAEWKDSTLRLARAAELAADSLHRTDALLPVVARRADLSISASEGLSSIAEEVLVRFDSLRRRYFGTGLPSPLGFRIALRWQSFLANSRYTGHEFHSLVLTAGSDPGHAPQLSPIRRSLASGSAEAWASEMFQHFGQLMMAGAQIRLQRWLPPEIAFHFSTEQRQRETMYALVTGAGRPQRGCAAGIAQDCSYAMGLGSAPATDTVKGPLYFHLARADLLHMALEIGGQGAWERLMAAGDRPVSDALQRASGLPIDSLLSRWRERLLALRSSNGPLGIATAVLLAGWTAVLLAGAVGVARWV